MNDLQITAVALVMGTVVTATLMVMGWQADMAWLPQVMLVVGGYFARSVMLIIKEM